ncbi:hypothetical protein [Hungatella effluvii]|uniref:hypothetical protein n=1 Tax=Hungatella effluvii TaxID=1096246 RepID=UPI002A821771|nr:hypothetical protein [Hungatella effluvii]
MSEINVCFQSELEIAREELILQFQKIGNKTCYLIAPIKKEKSEGVTLEDVMEDIAELIQLVGGTFSLKTDDIEESLKGFGEKLKNISFYLSAVYLYRKTVSTADGDSNKTSQTLNMEYAFGIGASFAEEQSNTFSIKNVSLCVWNFDCLKDDNAAQKRRKIIEKRMGIVDISSDDQIMQYLEGDSRQPQLES